MRMKLGKTIVLVSFLIALTAGLFILSSSVKANIIPFFTVTTGLTETGGYDVSGGLIYITERNEKVERVYDYSSNEVTTYSFDAYINAGDTWLGDYYVIAAWQTDNGTYTEGHFSLWRLDRELGKVYLGTGDGFGGALKMDDGDVFVSAQTFRGSNEDYFQKYVLKNFTQDYEIVFHDPADILLDSQTVYVLLIAPTRDIVISQYGGPVPGGTWVDKISILRRDSGSLVKKIVVKGGVSSMFKYGDYIVCTHAMVLDVGNSLHSTITFIETTSGNYETDEMRFGNYGIRSSVMAGGKIIGSLIEVVSDEWEGVLDTQQIIVFDLASRQAEFKTMNHEVGQVRYDPENQYVLIATPEGGDIYGYTLDSIING